MMVELIFDSLWADAMSDTWAGLAGAALLPILLVLITSLCGQVYGPRQAGEDD